MLDRILAFIVARWVGFKDWVVSLFSIDGGKRVRWPKIINIIPGVTKGNDFATSGQAFILLTVRDYIVGTAQWAWSKITAVPAYLLSPVGSYQSSGYSWKTLVVNFARWIGAKLRFLWELLKGLF